MKIKTLIISKLFCKKLNKNKLKKFYIFLFFFLLYKIISSIRNFQ